MARMTADGTVLERAGAPHDTLTVDLGDTVLLRNGMEGVAARWTKRGVAVRIGVRLPPAQYDGFPVLTLDVGDGDVLRVLRKVGESSGGN